MPGGVGGTVGSNTAHNSHHQDHADGSAQCVNCHVAVTHAWKRPRLLLNSDKDTAPWRSPKQIGTSRTNNGVPMFKWNGSTWVSVVAGTAGAANRIGMQSLSAVNDHVAIKNSTDPNVFPAAGLNSVGTDDMVYWSEPACQACNDHNGEDGVRIAEE